MLEERNLLRNIKDKSDSTTQLLISKDEQISAVMKEGELLIKKQHTQEQIIKKLRLDIKEHNIAMEKLKSEATGRTAIIDKQNESLKDIKLSK
jgi:hypothetical protein